MSEQGAQGGAAWGTLPGMVCCHPGHILWGGRAVSSRAGEETPDIEKVWDCFCIDGAISSWQHAESHQDARGPGQWEPHGAQEVCTGRGAARTQACGWASSRGWPTDMGPAPTRETPMELLVLALWPFGENWRWRMCVCLCDCGLWPGCDGLRLSILSSSFSMPSLPHGSS